MISAFWGSSPLARGLLILFLTGEHAYRIIPARAGFTPTVPPGLIKEADHPRSRGVYAPMRVTRWPFSGSSPLARGLRRGVHSHPGKYGIIPARAGFTAASGRPSGSGRDHPRSRGVYWALRLACAAICGSSPLARGLHTAEAGRPVRGRIIPARAGFTTSTPRSPRAASDHPRSRGVYVCFQARPRSAHGSSPLARGLPGAGGDLVEPCRIIPARAGFTYSSPS